MKKILLVAYYFPPAAGVGTFRVTKFVKYLSNYGWKPFVLTVKENNYISTDNSIISDTKRAEKIFRTKVKKLPINDVGLRWAFYLYVNAKKIIREEGIDVAYYTGGPFFQWIVAPMIKSATGIPYILDYRDPWGFNPYEKNKGSLKKRLGDLITIFFEPRVIARANGVIFATKEMEREYAKRFPKESDKFVVIENGFDPDDYKDVVPKKFKKFTITYTGKFSSYRNPDNLFRAIDTFRGKESYQFLHVGNEEGFVVDMARNILRNNAIFVGAKKYKESLSYAKGSDALVLISGGSNIEFTHKVFDYVSSDKPILAIVGKKTYLGKFLSSFENAFIVDDNVDDIKAALEAILNGSIGNLGKKNSLLLNSYRREYLTKKLSKFLNKIMDDNT